MNPLEVWYERLDVKDIIADAPDATTRKLRQGIADKARKRIGEYLFPNITTLVGGLHRLVDQPPIIYHGAEEA